MRSQLQISANVLLLVLWGGSLFVYPQLPTDVATHFGLSGEPDAWERTTLLGWMLLPTIALVMSVFFRFMGGFIAADPGGRLNIPGKARMQAVPERFRGPLEDFCHELMALVQLDVVAIMALVQFARWVEATGGDAQGWIMLVLVVSVLSSPVLLVFIMTRAQKATNAAWARANAEGVYEN